MTVAGVDRDRPTAAFIDEMRRRFPTERETDALLVRKLQRRAGPPYRRIAKDELSACLRAMFADTLPGTFAVSDERWFTGGVSKIQLGFTLEWDDPERGRSRDRLMVRMDPSESLNATSRVREYELLRAFDGVLPVPRVFGLDPAGRWFPEPALLYAFVDGVTRPTGATSGQVSGLGTNFGPALRGRLAPQFLEHLARVHTFDHASADLTALDLPRAGTTESALWQLNRARRVWEEDRADDLPLMEVAANWMQRNLPTTDVVSVVHGDFRSGNFLFDEATGEIRAWLDWERAHLGDRHRDLAWTTQALFGHYGAGDDRGTYYVCGLLPVDTFYERYEEASRLVVDHDALAFYRILNCYQIVVSTLATAYRVARLGKSHQDILLARVRGEVPIVIGELRALLKERL
jgi:aminoglycoside phosphotransferase (APT) family kinase protein